MTAPLTVKIVGIGGVGTWFLHALAPTLSFHAPESTLTLIDGDPFEPKNAERQLFDATKSSGNKATVVARELRDQFPNIFINDIPAWVVSDGKAVKREDDEDPAGKIQVSDLIDENDIIILSVDNNDTRRLVFEAVQNIDNIDILSGGNGTVEDGDALTGSVYHYRRRDGADVTGSPLHYHEEEYANAVGHNPGEMSCQERAKLAGGTQLVVANMSVAMLMMSKIVQAFLSEDPDTIAASLKKTEIYFDWAVAKADSADLPPMNIPAAAPATADTQENAENTVLA